MRSWKKTTNWEVAEQSTGRDFAVDVERRLILLQRAYDAGNVLALFEACALCDQQNIHLPGWIPSAALDLIARALKEGLSTKRKGGAHPLKRLQQDLKHFARWETVRSLIEHRNTSWREYQEFLHSPGLSPESFSDFPDLKDKVFVFTFAIFAFRLSHWHVSLKNPAKAAPGCESKTDTPSVQVTDVATIFLDLTGDVPAAKHPDLRHLPRWRNW